MIINGETKAGGVGVINVSLNGGNPFKVDVLVTHERPTDWDEYNKRWEG